MEMVMRTVDELRSMKSPPNQIDELPARLTEVLEEWRKLVAPAKRIETGIEDWFETTTAAFRERYEQEMKRWCLALSIVVAVSLDANFFRFANEAFQPNPDVAAGLKLIDLDKIRHPFTAVGFKHLTGWFVTSLLLSTGAPFWQDALQSLFGLKNFLRKPAEATLDGRLI